MKLSFQLCDYSMVHGGNKYPKLQCILRVPFRRRIKFQKKRGECVSTVIENIHFFLNTVRL